MAVYTFVKNLSIIVLLLTFAVNIEACDYPERVDKGKVIECKGVVLSEPQFIEAGNNKKKLRIQDLKIAEYEGMEELYELRHSHYKRELKDTKNELKWLQIKSTAGYVISFSLGAIITGMIAKEVLK
jgi:hypothetical protein